MSQFKKDKMGKSFEFNKSKFSNNMARKRRNINILIYHMMGYAEAANIHYAVTKET